MRMSLKQGPCGKGRRLHCLLQTKNHSTKFKIYYAYNKSLIVLHNKSKIVLICVCIWLCVFVWMLLYQGIGESKVWAWSRGGVCDWALRSCVNWFLSNLIEVLFCVNCVCNLQLLRRIFNQKSSKSSSTKINFLPILDSFLEGGLWRIGEDVLQIL